MLRFLAIRNLAVIESVEVEFDGRTERPDGRDRRRQVDPRRGGRPAARRPRVPGPGSDRRGHRRRPGHVRRPGRRRTARPPRGDRRRAEAARSSTAHSSTAAALRELGARLVDLHGQHEHQALLDPETHLDLLDRYAGLDAEREQVARAFADYAGSASRRSTRSARCPRSERSRLEIAEFQLAEIDAREAAAGRGRGTRRAAHAALERRARPAPRGGKLRASSTTATRPCSRLSARCGSGWGSWPSLDARFAPYLEARDAVKSQLEDLAAVPPRLRRRASTRRRRGSRRSRTGSPCSSASRGSTGRRSPTSSTKQAALEEELAGLESLVRSDRRRRSRASPRARQAYLAIARALSAAQAVGRGPVRAGNDRSS